MKSSIFRGKSISRFFFRGSEKNDSPNWLFIVLGFFAVIFPIISFSFGSGMPALDETAYVEHSRLGKGAGSVIPASCDSDDPYRDPTITVVDPGTGLTTPGGTPGSHFPGDCITNCPSGIGTYDPYYDPGASGCPSLRYVICPASATVAAGGTQQYLAYYNAGGLSCSNLAGATNVTGLVTWTSSSPSVGTVGNGATAGLATAVTTTGGTTGITVSSYSGESAPGVTFAVQSSNTPLRICPPSLIMVRGSTYQMRAYYRLGGVDCSNVGVALEVTNLVTWTSTAPLVASVGNGATAGSVTAIDLGSTNINISNYAGQAAPRAVVFIVGGTAICPANPSTYTGGTTQLRAYYSLTGAVNCGNLAGTIEITGSVSWFSSNPAVATVAGGVVSGVSSGVSSISITPYNGSLAAPVNATIIGGYKICPASAIVSALGFPFRSFYNPAGAVDCGNTGGLSDVTGSVTWSSSNLGVVTVGNGGSAGIASLVGLGSSNISTTPYSGIPSGNAVANVVCVPSVSCVSPGPAATAANTCPGNTFTVDNGCGQLITCSGTRTCDFNWREVSQ